MNIIDIWEIPFKELVINYKHKNILNEDELITANRFLKHEDKNNYILSHSYLRVILTKYFPHIEARDWKFYKNKYGKPYILKEHNVNIYFNLSHCSSCAYVIISNFENCGIDVEDIKKIDLNKNILQFVFSKQEEEDFTNAKNNLELFYTYWTLKEAHLKAMGKGLCIEPNKIEFSRTLSLQKYNTSFSVNQNNHYCIHNIKNKVILSYAILNDNIKILRSTFYNVKDL